MIIALLLVFMFIRSKCCNSSIEQDYRLLKKELLLVSNKIYLRYAFLQKKKKLLDLLAVENEG